MKSINYKNQRGITLLSLAITVIVITILAGISIRVFSGDSGLFNFAVKAKQVTEISEAIERMEEEVVYSMRSDGVLNMERLNKNLSRNLRSNFLCVWR